MITASQRKTLNIKLQEMKLIVSQLIQMEDSKELVINKIEIERKLRKVIEEYNIKNFEWDYETTWEPPTGGAPNTQYQKPIKYKQLRDEKKLYFDKVKELKNKLNTILSEIYTNISNNII